MNSQVYSTVLYVLISEKKKKDIRVVVYCTEDQKFSKFSFLFIYPYFFQDGSICKKNLIYCIESLGQAWLDMNI